MDLSVVSSCSITQGEMNVVMHFIYGGTLDFPDKANVGYVLLFKRKFKRKSYMGSILLNYFAESR